MADYSDGAWCSHCGDLGTGGHRLGCGFNPLPASICVTGDPRDAEIARLRAEVERLTADAHQWRRQAEVEADINSRFRDALKAGPAALRGGAWQGHEKCADAVEAAQERALRGES